MKKCYMIWAMSVIAILFSACGTETVSEFGERIEAFDVSAWETSKWISVVDAPVVTGKTSDVDNNRAADGASWFVSTLKNEQKVVSAKWMTAGLGVYEIFVNGRPIGKEFLKPGYTHYAKTKRSFTYDVTAAFQTEAGAENQLSAKSLQVGGLTRFTLLMAMKAFWVRSVHSVVCWS